MDFQMKQNVENHPSNIFTKFGSKITSGFRKIDLSLWTFGLGELKIKPNKLIRDQLCIQKSSFPKPHVE
jgi:hypothetical protein